MNRTALPITPTAIGELSRITRGQLVSVSAPGTWLDGRAGVVLQVGRFADELVDVTISGSTPLGPNPVRTMDPCRLTPAASLTRCDTCRNGCDCDGSTGTLACGHYCCWGRGHDNIVNCDGVAYEYARKAALSGAREQAQIEAARRRYDGSLPRVIADILTAHGLAAGDDELAA